MKTMSSARLLYLTQGFVILWGLIRARAVVLPWLLPSLLLMLLLLSRADSAHAQAQSGTWSPTGSMTTARFFHTATRLANGKVLVAGGYNQVSSAELYDPATGTWSLTGSMSTARADHTATLLSTGQVLAAGGFGGSNPLQGDPLASAELYNSASSGADLALSITDTPDPVTVSQPLTYTLTVTNNGPAAASGVTVTDPLPSTATFVSAKASQGSCSGTTVSLTATPASGWKFDHWSGDCTGTATSCTVSMTQDRKVSATFVKAK